MAPAIDVADRLALARRYLALGLRAAARALLERLVHGQAEGAIAAEAAAEAAAELARLALEAGEDPARALEQARRALRDDARPAHRLLLAEAQAASDDLKGAAATYRAVLDDPAAGADLLCAARVGLAGVAQRAGRAEEALRWLGQLGGSDELSLELVDDIAALAAAAGGATSLLEGLGEQPGSGCHQLLRAELLAQLDRPTAEVETALRAAGDLPLARLALALRLARRRGRQPEARREALELLRRLLQEALEGTGVSAARVHLLLASIEDDDPDRAEAAAEHYRRALALLPRDAFACNNLAVIALGRAEHETARRWLIRALTSDALHEKSYLNLARLLYAAGAPAEMAATLETLLAAGLDARGLANLCFALVEVAREDAQRGLGHKGHQLKNLLGVAGSRARSLARSAEGSALETALGRLAERLGAVYQEWALFLRTLREEPSTMDVIGGAELVEEAARRAGSGVRLELAGRLPDVRGVREQLVEALVNLIRNGLEACADPPPTVRARAGQGGQLELEIEDHGPGIAPRDLRRIFSPGYTTKAGGSGLGLSISERIIRSHQGQLEIRSDRGGTTVHVGLPVHLESEARQGRWRHPLPSVVRAVEADEVVVEE